MNKYKYTTEEVLGPWKYVSEFEEYDGGIELYPALVYRDHYYIIIEPDGYFLLIENEFWNSQCLRELEEILADYLVSSGSVQFKTTVEIT